MQDIQHEVTESMQKQFHSVIEQVDLYSDDDAVVKWVHARSNSYFVFRKGSWVPAEDAGVYTWWRSEDGKYLKYDFCRISKESASSARRDAKGEIVVGGWYRPQAPRMSLPFG